MSLKKMLGLGLMAAAIATSGEAAPRTASNATFAGPSMWVGSAMDGVFSGNATTPALSALFALNPSAVVQTYFSLPAISPFQFGLGANVKFNLTGDAKKGLHAGGGLSLGLAPGGLGGSAFFVNIAPLVGVHFELVNNVLVSLDSSLALRINTAAGSSVGMTIGGNSALLGASVLIGI